MLNLLHWPLEAVLAIVAGILILLVPRVLGYVVAVYLLMTGILGGLHFWYGHSIRPQAVLALVAGILILVRPALLHWVAGSYLIVVGVLELGLIRF
jgi:hypothetical protein